MARCAACGRVFHPVRPTCTACGAATSTLAHQGAGSVVSWTRIERPPEGFEAPQRIVLVALDGTGDAATLVYARADDDGLLRTGAVVQVRDSEAGVVAARG